MDIIDYIFNFIQSIDPFWFMKLFTWARIGDWYFGTFFTILFWLSLFLAIVSIGTTDILKNILEPIYNVLVYFKINPYNIWIVLQIILLFIFSDKKKMMIFQILITVIIFLVRMYITKNIFKVLLSYMIYMFFLFVLRSSLKYVPDPNTFVSIVCIIINIIIYKIDKHNDYI